MRTWVERIFEVFSTITVGSFFTLLQVITPEQSTTVSLFAAAIFMLGCLPGVFYYLVFTGCFWNVLGAGLIPRDQLLRACHILHRRARPRRHVWHLIWMIVLSGPLSDTLCMSGLIYGSRSNLAVMEHWCWGIMRTWVEKIFEVFSTFIVSPFFTLL